MTNPLKNNKLVRGAWCRVAALLLAAACGHKHAPPPGPQPTAPLPTQAIAGEHVALVPVTLVATDEALHWDSLVADRRATLLKCDSIIGSLLAARATEVNWVLPDELRRQARRSPSVATDPDQLGTAALRGELVVDVPDPLRAQLRTLVAIADSRYVLAPAALVYRRIVGSPESRMGTAELTLALVDGRLGKVVWRTVARGDGDDPWSALTRAVKSLTPGLP